MGDKMNELPVSVDSSIGDADDFCKNSLVTIMQLVRSSHALPKAGDDHEFYSSFSGFQEFLSYQKGQLMKFMSMLMKNNGLNSNLTGLAGSSLDDVDEYTDKLIECNDTLLERVAALLDSCEKSSGDTTAVKPLDTGNSSNASLNSDVVISSWNKNQNSGGSRTFRLIHAHNILRPQLNFKDKIDNSNTPFLPKIKVKPHALKPLATRLVEINTPSKEKDLNIAPALSNLISSVRSFGEEDNSIYKHPYEYELRSWEPLPHQLETVEPQKFLPLEQDSCVFVDSPDVLRQLLDTLKGEKEFAVDLEHHSYRSFQGITCLMQISTRTSDYIVDTIALRADLWILNDVFADPSIVKVFHGADFDVVWLQRDFGIYVINMFDTGVASRVLELDRFSLQYLAELYCNVQFDKKYQLADWRIRPLPLEMIYYAQSDTHYLLYISDVMRNALIERANGESRLLRVVLDRSRDVCLNRYEKPLIDSDSHLQLLERMQRRRGHVTKSHTPQQLEALRLIYQWRDSLARREDESPGYVLPNHMLLQIAEILPKEAQGVLACCNPIPPLLRQHVQAVHQLVKDARVSSAATRNYKNPEEHTKVPVPAKTDHDTTDLLTCPHDLSQKSSRLSDATSLANTCSVISRSTSALLGPFEGDSSSFSKNVSVSRSDGVCCAFSKEKSQLDSVQEKLCKILKTSWNPFKLFLPSSGKVAASKKSAPSSKPSVTQPLTLRHMLSGNFPWKMRRLELSKEEEEEEKRKSEQKNAEPKTFGKVVEVPLEATRSTEQQVKAIRQIMKNEKVGKVSLQPEIKPVIHVDGVPSDLQFAEESDDLFATRRKSNDGFKNPAGKKKPKRPRSQHTSNGPPPKRSFQPHHYSRDDYNQFKRPRESKKRRFK